MEPKTAKHQRIILFNGRAITMKSTLDTSLFARIKRWYNRKYRGIKEAELFDVKIEVATPLAVPIGTYLIGPDGIEWCVTWTSRNFKHLTSTKPVGVNFRKEGQFKVVVG